ncbi:OstA-like protein [Salinimicrobium sp. GXAS 041]|uniref:OstA-like protein n=1 Tax=Salinimicrobium sp. GXAS 041 TaxID=3400806 RepID=UPI003C779620
MKQFRIIGILLLLLFCETSVLAQEVRKIDYTSDRTIRDEQRYPGALILSKVDEQVHFTHEGIEIWCDQAIHYDQENFFKAFGNVRMEQGDTITMNSQYAEYNGNTEFAFASGNVRMRNPQTSLTTDTLFFDRAKQQAYYRSGGTVRDTASVLKSRVGRYFLESQKYSFSSDVVLTNPEYVINSAQLDFYSETGNVFFYGPTTIESETSTIYCERGFYDTRGDTGYFVKNSRIDYEQRILEGDSLYFNRNTNFASATNNIKVTDTVNNSIIRGHYAEVYREKDSVFITKRALAVTLQDRDSVYIHSDTLMVTGKPDDRIIRGFYDVRLFKSNMSGKSDSIHVQQTTGLTQMIGNPVIWSQNNQLTGDTIHLLNNVETEELDSLKVYNNAFMIQKDSIEGYNQLKGKELYGLFKENDLYQVDILKNTETLYYMRNDAGELIGINKTLSSSIKVLLEEQVVQDVYYYKQIDGNLTPENEVPPFERELIGFNWRGEERLESVDDLFAGEPPLELTRIEGIPLPSPETEFFEDREKDDPLLNEKSRLRPEDLKTRKQDSIAPQPEEILPEPLIEAEKEE